LQTATTPENQTPNKLPIETVKSNLRNINIVSYSYGGSIAVQLSNAMRASMEKLQYSGQEISQAMQQISLLTLGSVGNIANQKNQFTTLNILNPGDEMVAKHSKNLKTAQAIDLETNIPTPISGDQRQMIILQQVDAIRLKLSSAGLSETSEPDPHKPINYVNFLQGEEGIAVASPAAIYAANSLIHSVASLQSGFTPLPTVAQMLNEIPPPVEELAKKFNTANKSKQRI